MPHLNQFVHKESGGCQKLIKNTEYPVDVEISKELLFPGVENKNVKCHRPYRLFAVVRCPGPVQRVVMTLQASFGSARSG